MKSTPLNLPQGPCPGQGCADPDLSRRGFLALSSTAVAASMLPPGVNGAPAATAKDAAAAHSVPKMAKVSFKVNGKAHNLEVDTRTTLLDALREHLHLTGSKKGCDQGQCGGCTVIADGRRINSCLTLAVMHPGAKITTVEGLGQPDNLHPMQAAFVKHDGYQCGYCTSGQICSAVAVLGEIKAGIPSHATPDLMQAPQFSSAEIRERMSGNLCRCGAYSNIFDAITQAAEKGGAAVKQGGKA